MKKIGFIGAGMMAEALIRGVIRAEIAKPSEIVASDVSAERLRTLAGDPGIETAGDNQAVYEASETVVLAVKPQHFAEAARGLGATAARPLVISIMAGVPTAAIEAALPEGTPVVRAMPNLPAVVGEGAAALAKGEHATDAHVELAVGILAAVGKALPVEERLMDAVTGLSGSGPAFALLAIEALADGGVAEGLPRPVALELAAQSLLGAAKMVLATGEHPASLRDRIVSPAGTTAEGLLALEARGARDAFAQAVRAATRRSRELGKGTT